MIGHENADLHCALDRTDQLQEFRAPPWGEAPAARSPCGEAQRAPCVPFPRSFESLQGKAALFTDSNIRIGPGVRLSSFGSYSLTPTSLHPSLLEPDYWRKRLELQRLVRHGLLTLPRPDLSSRTLEVLEIKFRAHDGVRLWGLMGRCRLLQGKLPARLRVVGPAEPAAIAERDVEGGFVEFVLQEPPGRRLEDRVLDVVRLCQLAASMGGVDTSRIELGDGRERPAPDEFLIAARLREGGLLATD